MLQESFSASRRNGNFLCGNVFWFFLCPVDQTTQYLVIAFEFNGCSSDSLTKPIHLNFRPISVPLSHMPSGSGAAWRHKRQRDESRDQSGGKTAGCRLPGWLLLQNQRRHFPEEVAQLQCGGPSRYPLAYVRLHRWFHQSLLQLYHFSKRQTGEEKRAQKNLQGFHRKLKTSKT